MDEIEILRLQDDGCPHAAEPPPKPVAPAPENVASATTYRCVVCGRSFPAEGFHALVTCAACWYAAVTSSDADADA